MSILHGYVPVLAIYNSVVTGPLGYVSLVKMVTSCDCVLTAVYQTSSIAVHRVLYPALFAKISLLQLLIVKYGKKIVSLKVTLIVVAVTTLLYMPVLVLLFVFFRPKTCEHLCLGLDGSSGRGYMIVQVASWVTCMAVIVVCYIGIWMLFKKGALHGSRGESHAISLKIATLPAIMPLVMHIEIFPFFLYFTRFGTGSVLSGKWWHICVFSAYLFSDLSGLVYPIILLYLSSSIRACWKKMFRACLGRVKVSKIASLHCCLQCHSKLCLHRENQAVLPENQTWSKSSQLTNSSQPTDSSRPTESSQAMEHSQLTDSSQPTDSSRPAESSQPMDHSQLTDSSQPMETSQPFENFQPMESSHPITLTVVVESAV